jgi:glucokinase
MMSDGSTALPPSEGRLQPRVFALDLGATRLRAAAITAGGELLARREVPTARDGSPRALVGSIVDLLSAVAADLPADSRARIEGIGVSAVGPLDSARGVLLGPPNLGAGYRGLELAEPLRNHFGLPTTIERDTNVAALGERAYGAARGRESFIYLTVSTGVGGGVVERGRLLGGRHGFAGELGHVPVALGGPVCACGQPGHLEAFASGTGIARRGRDAVADGSSPLLAKLARERDGTDLGSIDVLDAAARGDAAAKTIVAQAIEAFAVAALGFVNAFDPELIVVGGAVATALGDPLLDAARAKISLALGPAARRTPIAFAELGDDVGLLGCLALVEERIVAPTAERRDRPGAGAQV